MLPGKVEEILRTCDSRVRAACPPYSNARDFLFLGRGIHYPDRARRRAEAEGDFLHPCRGLSGGRDEARPERAHRRDAAGGGAGDEGRMRIADSVLRYEKTLSNIQEVTARSGKVIAVATEGDDHIGQLVDHVLFVPQRTGVAAAGARCDSAAIAGLSHRRAPRLRCRSAAQSGEIGHGRIARQGL